MQSVTSNAVYGQLEGCKLKSFSYIVVSVVAGNDYSISKTALGLPVDADVVGIALIEVGGNMQWDFNATLFYKTNTGEFLFFPHVTQDWCRVSGVVFYK